MAARAYFLQIVVGRGQDHPRQVWRAEICELFASRVQQVHEEVLKPDRDARVLPPHRPFQRLSNLLYRIFLGPGFCDDVTPHGRQGFPGVKRPLDDHAL